MIRHDGHAYPCCQLGNNPKVAIGNINTQTFEELINHPKLQEMRKQSLESRLPCYENCDQAKYFEAFPVERPKDVFTTPEAYRDLQIEYGELCNVDCVMCWQDRTNQKQLSYDRLIKVLPTDMWKIITAYGGEIFVMKDALRHVIHLLEQKKSNVIVTTNGKTLTNRGIAEKLVSLGSAINISINAATEKTHSLVMRPREPFFNELLKSVRQMQELKSQLNRPHFRINGQFTAVIESLDEIPLFIEKFEDFGFDTISITFDHRHFPHYLVERPQFTKDLGLRISNSLSRIKNPSRVVLADHNRFLNSING